MRLGGAKRQSSSHLLGGAGTTSSVSSSSSPSWLPSWLVPWNLCQTLSTLWHQTLKKAAAARRTADSRHAAGFGRGLLSSAGQEKHEKAACGATQQQQQEEEGSWGGFLLSFSRALFVLGIVGLLLLRALVLFLDGQHLQESRHRGICDFVPVIPILSEEALVKMGLPTPKDDEWTALKSLSYLTLSDEEVAKETKAWDLKQLDQKRSTSAALEMFSGAQSLQQRDESFKISEHKTVHCGFGAKGSGFDISQADRSFMETCTVVVATAIFGGARDFLRQPEGVYESTKNNTAICFVAFWGEITLSEFVKDQSSLDEFGPKAGIDLGSWDRRLGMWRIVLVSNLPFVDHRLNGKIPKMLSHRLFPLARYSIWVDAKLVLQRDPLAILESVLWRERKAFAITEHWKRKCVFEEAERNIELRKAPAQMIRMQVDQYEREGLTKDATFNGLPAMAEGSFIIRGHTPLTNLFMCLWFNENIHFTSRDQLSFGHVLRRMNDLKPFIFGLCDRLAMVTELHHKMEDIEPLPK